MSITSKSTNEVGKQGSKYLGGILAGYIPVRYIVLVLLLCCFSFTSMVRAVVAVVLASLSSREPNATMRVEQMTTVENDDLNWSENVKNIIFSSYFVGLVLTQVPGSYIVARYGNKFVIAAFQGACIVLQLIFPLTALKGGYQAVIALNLVQGMLTGVVFPSFFPIIAQWVPDNERQTANCLVFSAMLLLMAGVYTATGQIVAALHWSAAFYMAGAIGVIWLIFWLMLMSDSPEKCLYITEKELEVIGSCQASNPSAESKTPPYRQLLKSSCVWAIIVCEFTNNWSATLISLYIPSYMLNVVGENIQQSAFLSSLPLVSSAIAVGTVAVLGRLVLKHQLLSTISLRRMAVFVSFGGASGALVALCSTSPHVVTVSIIFVVLTLLMGTASLGHLVNTMDISPNFCGAINAMANIAGGVAALLNPLVFTAVVQDKSDPNHWHIMFCISILFYIFSLLIFLKFASAKRQYWDKIETTIQERGKQSTD